MQKKNQVTDLLFYWKMIGKIYNDINSGRYSPLVFLFWWKKGKWRNVLLNTQIYSTDDNKLNKEL